MTTEGMDTDARIARRILIATLTLTIIMLISLGWRWRPLWISEDAARRARETGDAWTNALVAGEVDAALATDPTWVGPGDDQVRAERAKRFLQLRAQILGTGTSMTANFVSLQKCRMIRYGVQVRYRVETRSQSIDVLLCVEKDEYAQEDRWAIRCQGFVPAGSSDGGC